MNILDKIMIIAFILLFSFSGLNAFSPDMVTTENFDTHFQNITLNIIAIFLVILYTFCRLTYKIKQWNKNTTLDKDFYYKDKN